MNEYTYPRYEVVRSTKYFGYIVWDNQNFDYVKKPNGHFHVFEDETEAYLFIDGLSLKG